MSTITKSHQNFDLGSEEHCAHVYYEMGNFKSHTHMIKYHIISTCIYIISTVPLTWEAMRGGYIGAYTHGANHNLVIYNTGIFFIIHLYLIIHAIHKIQFITNEWSLQY